MFLIIKHLPLHYFQCGIFIFLYGTVNVNQMEMSKVVHSVIAEEEPRGEGCGRDHVCAPIVQVIHGDAGEQTGA